MGKIEIKPGVFEETKSVVVKTTIDTNALKQELEEINRQIDNLAKPKTKPDEETLYYWNSTRVINPDISIYYGDRKREIENILKEYK